MSRADWKGSCPKSLTRKSSKCCGLHPLQQLLTNESKTNTAKIVDRFKALSSSP